MSLLDGCIFGVCCSWASEGEIGGIMAGLPGRGARGGRLVLFPPVGVAVASVLVLPVGEVRGMFSMCCAMPSSESVDISSGELPGVGPGLQVSESWLMLAAWEGPDGPVM